MESKEHSDLFEKAAKLLDEGWKPNLASGSVTHAQSGRAGIVEDNVWNAMKDLNRTRAFDPTLPMPKKA